MDKLTFISQIKPILKQKNYRKNGNYWYKTVNDYICCINVQGSQWDKDDYYVQIGFSISADKHANPSIMQWYCSHRCKGASGEVNILPQELLAVMEDVFNQVTSASQIPTFLKNRNATRVGALFWF